MLLRRPFRPTGPFIVGARDLAWSQPANSGVVLAPDKHLVARLLYPASSPTKTPVTWLPHVKYGWGYGNSLMPTVSTWKMKVARVVLQLITCLLGFTAALPVNYNAPLLPVKLATRDDEDSQSEAQRRRTSQFSRAPLQPAAISSSGAHPVVIFSHGLHGNRNTYSSICAELASQGYVVLAIEHADGTASAAHLAGTASNAAELPGTHGRWRFYPGWGSMQVAHARTRWRQQEVLTAHRLLQQLAQGLDVPGLSLSGMRKGSASTTFDLAGRLDMQRVCVMGHSWGGATAASVAAEHSQFAAAVAMDPWWEALPPESGPLKGVWRTQAPLLVLGSHAWNTPSASGKLACGGAQQEAVLAAAAAGSRAASQHASAAGRTANGTSHTAEGNVVRGPAAHAPAGDGEGGVSTPRNGPGALLLVWRGSSHNSYDDVLLYFGSLFKPLLKVLKLQATLDPAKALSLTAQAATRFLRTHLPPAGTHLPPAATDEAGSDVASRTHVERPRPWHREDRDLYAAMFGDDAAIVRLSGSQA